MAPGAPLPGRCGRSLTGERGRMKDPASVRTRAIQRACQAWLRGRPHEAWRALDQAGLASYWPEFQRRALAHARRRYLSAIRRVS